MTGKQPKRGDSVKILERILSYLLVAALAATVTAAVLLRDGRKTDKLDELNALIHEKYIDIDEVSDTALEDGAAMGMIEAMGDRWSYYVPAADYAAYQNESNNSYVGIGITIQEREDGLGYDIRKVAAGGPSEEAGLLPGDILTKANGQEVGKLELSESRDIILGPEGTYVDITVQRDGEELTFSIQRRTIETQVAVGRMVTDEIGLVQIVNFHSRCAQESIAQVEDLMAQGAKSIIFDVRFNPGGYAHEMVALLDYLLPEGDLFRSVDYTGREDVDRSDAACLDIPMAVLVNADSYSAAEFFAAALREYGVAEVVGEPTCGKGNFQQTYRLSDGSAASISVGKYYTPNGVSLADEGGLVPDVVVTVDEDTAYKLYLGLLPDGEDPQLQAAVEALKTGE